MSEVKPRFLLVSTGSSVLRLEIHPQHSALQLLAASTLRFLPAHCGGRGKCGGCKVKVRRAARGEISRSNPTVSEADRRLLSETELAGGVRLACTLAAAEVAELELPVSSTGTSFHSRSAPRIRGCVDPLQTAETGKGLHPALGIAVDLGTTTVGAYLLDLSPVLDGDSFAQSNVAEARVLAVRSAMNRQAVFGADVLSRISYAEQHGTKELQRSAVAVLNVLIGELLDEAGLKSRRVTHIAVAGNPTMLHLLLGKDPRGIGRAPFTPAFTASRSLRAGELGISHCPDAVVQLLPSVSAYVGADTVAALIAEDLDLSRDSFLFIDAGTNGELVLGHAGSLTACSAAAGPAFEGTSLSSGVAGTAGAIYQWRREGDSFRHATIAGAPPIGLCGAGALDVAACLLNDGVLDEHGSFLDVSPLRGESGAAYQGRLFGQAGGKGFELVPGIHFTQGDVRELQLAKAAIAAGADVLLENSGIGIADLDRIILTGGFGQSLNAGSAVRLGLLPPVAPDRVHTVTDAALSGAARLLLQRSSLHRAQEVQQRLRYFELSGSQEFREKYIEHMPFPRVRGHTGEGDIQHGNG